MAADPANEWERRYRASIATSQAEDPDGDAGPVEIAGWYTTWLPGVVGLLGLAVALIAGLGRLRRKHT